MSKIYLADANGYDTKIGKKILGTFENKVKAFPPGTCPVQAEWSMLQTSIAQTCGKCVPCRDGLPQIAEMMKQILDGNGSREMLNELQSLAQMVQETADCAIGYQAAAEVLEGLDAFKAEYESHVEQGQCAAEVGQQVPCINQCPAHVDVPGYIAFVGEKNYADAINLIRKDNPLPTACAMICEHPCEERCRRTLIDAPINIRAIKKVAVDKVPADQVKVPERNVDTGKKIAVIGGGPSGLTAAYFLALMGHKVVIFEAKEKLGGMLRYGIPNYRFPKTRLEEDTNAILSVGNIEVKYNTEVGKDIAIEDVYKEYDAVYAAIGAQIGKTLRLEGSDAKNVFSAVEILDRIGHDEIPDYTGKSVAVIGGGNVAMDAARSALRCNAKEVHIVYRRRQEDMTALVSEVESAVMEGIDLMILQAPKAIEKDVDGNCTALITQPQMIGPYDKAGRPAPMNANKEPVRVPADVIMIAVGQDIVSEPFEAFGIPTDRKTFVAGLDCEVAEKPGFFTGGDCATGPSTAIKAIAAGKVAAHNIDEYLGYHHKLDCGVCAPEAKENNRIPTGRVNIVERPAAIRKCDFEHVETELTDEEAMQEANRCLRCDHFGCGVMEGGR